MDFLSGLMKNHMFLMSLAVALGLLFGQIRIKGLNLGISGALFTGLLLGTMGFTVPKQYFLWNLVIFVVCVGLLAAEDIVMVVKRYGLKFIILGLVVTGVGALVTFLLTLLSRGGVSPHLIAGTYTGALTSSPGLGAALEATNGNPLVTVGHTVAYPFGVIGVVLFVQLIPAIFGIDVKKEREELRAMIESYRDSQGERREESVFFALMSFVVCIVGGVLLGSLKVRLPGLGAIGLGSTGGALIFSLFAGALGRLGPLSMRMDKKTLSAMRALSLAYFLAVVGLMAGPELVTAVTEHGLLLIGIGVFAALAAEMVGFFLGHYVWKLNWVLLSGAICGAMTSTPGLGAAIDATGSEDCASGYGATYPIAIVSMVIFTTFLHVAFNAMGYGH